MVQISLSPHDAPETLVYKYFQDKIVTQTNPIKYRDKQVPFIFEYSKSPDVYPQIRLEFIRQMMSSNLRYVGDDMLAMNSETNLYEKVTIGEPFEAIWGLVVEGSTRDAVYNILQQIRVKMGRTGCQKSPIYIEHSRIERYDHMGTNSLYKSESEELRFIGRLGFKTYMRLAGGVPDPNYAPRPKVEEIVLELGTMDKEN